MDEETSVGGKPISPAITPVVTSHKTTLRRRFRRLFRWVFIPTVVLVAVVFWFRYPLLRGAAGFLVYESNPKPCDVVIALGGGLTERIEKAVELMQQGYAREILLPLPEELAPDAVYKDLLEMERRMCKAVLELRGVASDKVHWSSEPLYSTYAEIKFIQRWMKQNGDRSAIIVPGLFQSRRAKWTADRMFKGSGCDILVIPAPEQVVSATNWWTNEEGIVTVENEYIKNIYYIVKSVVGEP